MFKTIKYRNEVRRALILISIYWAYMLLYHSLNISRFYTLPKETSQRIIEISNSTTKQDISEGLDIIIDCVWRIFISTLSLLRAKEYENIIQILFSDFSIFLIFIVKMLPFIIMYIFIQSLLSHEAIVKIRKEDRFFRFVYCLIYQNKYASIIILFLSNFPVFFKVIIPWLMINTLKEYVSIIGVSNFLLTFLSVNIMSNQQFSKEGGIETKGTNEIIIIYSIQIMWTVAIPIFMIGYRIFSKCDNSYYEGKIISSSDSNVDHD